LIENTDNQYFITTHSAHILDTPCAQVFHIRLENRETRVSHVSNSLAQYSICRDLGNRASDIVQSNSVVWVEGPSDRIYLRHWIAIVDKELVEGLHYSIMHYGGRLLSYLTPVDPVNARELQELISLRRLNRNSIVVMDRDTHKLDAPLRKEKLDLIGAFGNAGLAWVTAGREIENYVPHATLVEAYREAHPRKDRRPSSRRFERLLLNGDDKIAVARAVVKRQNSRKDIGRLDLLERLDQLVAYIRSANHLEVPPGVMPTAGGDE
jgi:hypothetical protein